MDLKFSFFVCVVIIIILSTVHASTNVNLSCENITDHPEKEPLTLHCRVTCMSGCEVKTYIWRNIGVNKLLNKSTTPKNIKNYEDFSYTIQNQSDKQSGTYTFWIQTAQREYKETFTVTIVKKGEIKDSTNKEDNGSSRVVIAFVVLIIFVAVPTVIVAGYKRSVTLRSVVHRWFGCFAQTETFPCEHVVYVDPVGDDCES